MKLENEMTARVYTFNTQELKRMLNIKGMIKNIEFKGDELILHTVEERLPKENVIGNILGNLNFGGGPR
jgi:hypothetical protein